MADGTLKIVVSLYGLYACDVRTYVRKDTRVYTLNYAEHAKRFTQIWNLLILDTYPPCFIFAELHAIIYRLYYNIYTKNPI